MESAMAAKADIMERRLMGGGPGGLTALTQGDVGRGSPDGNSEDDYHSEDGIYYRRVFAPLSSNSSETTMIDFVVLQNDGEEPAADLSDDHMEMDADAAAASARGGDIISRIVAKYVVPGKTARNLGYEDDDDFFDDSEQMARQRDGNVETAHGGFFVNAGDIDTRKRKREDSPVQDESPYKRRRGERDYDRDTDAPIVKTFDPALEDALKEFGEAVKKGGYSDTKRFPKELDPQLAKIAQVASSRHPNGWITMDICNRVAQYLPLQPGTLRLRMKQLTNPNAAPQEDDDSDLLPLGAAASQAGGNTSAAEDAANINPAHTEERIRRLEHYKKTRDEWMNQFKETVDRKLGSIMGMPDVQALITSMIGVNREGVAPPGRDRWRWGPEQKQLIVYIYEINSKIVKLHNRVRSELIALGRTMDAQRLGPEMAERNEVSALYKFFVNCFPAGWYINQSFAQMVAVERKKIGEIPIPPMDQHGAMFPSSPTPQMPSSFPGSSPLSRSNDFGVPQISSPPPIIYATSNDGAIVIPSLGSNSRKQKIKPKTISGDGSGSEAAYDLSSSQHLVTEAASTGPSL